MKTGFFVFLLVNFMAYTLAFAQEAAMATKANGSNGSTVDSTVEAQADCASELIKADVLMQEANGRLRDARLSQRGAYDQYLQSFNQMTEVLFQMTTQREEETQKMSENKNQLRDSLAQFAVDKSNESSKQLQESYFNLTVRLYSALIDSQKTLETLRLELAQVESTRGQFDLSKKDIDQLEQTKLSAEQKLVNLQLRCRANL